MPKPEPLPYSATQTPALEEETKVHEVYEAIAPHFSQTRHKGWPLVTSFLASLPPDTIGLDSGAGNGKYLPYACSSEGQAGPSRHVVALDRSRGLLDIARNQLSYGGECLRAELGYEGWRDGVFDWAISVAAIHHLTTPERRKQSVQALIRPLVLRSEPSYSRFMIYVWAYEQGSMSKRKMGKATGPASAPQPSAGPADPPSSGADQGKEKVQDVLVPWVYQPPPNPDAPAQEQEKKVYHRYYHLFLAGELRRLVVDAAEEDGFVVVTDDTFAVSEGTRWLRICGEGWEADNWWLEGEVGVGPVRI